MQIIFELIKVTLGDGPKYIMEKFGPSILLQRRRSMSERVSELP
jgi:hypothetical protein